jgi:hypothetical protein
VAGRGRGTRRDWFERLEYVVPPVLQLPYRRLYIVESPGVSENLSPLTYVKFRPSAMQFVDPGLQDTIALPTL